jgi:hypothetical protein
VPGEKGFLVITVRTTMAITQNNTGNYNKIMQEE